MILTNIFLIRRIDTHVISVTFSVLKHGNTGNTPWPLEAIGTDGKRYRYHHPPGTMVLYESSSRSHGRPYKNKDGTHCGTFLHFRPSGSYAIDIYEGMVREARALKESMTQWG